MYYQIFIQSIAIVALIFWGISYQLKTRRSILLFQLISSIFYIIHFFLLRANAGAVIVIVVALRLALFSFKKKDNWISHPLVLWGFMILSFIATILTYSGYWVIFAFAGSILAIIACWQHNTKTIRILFIPSHICWIVYDAFAGSYGGVISETILGLSTVTSLFRKKLNTDDNKI